MNEKAFEIWNTKWNSDIHTTEHAIKRIQSAKTAKLTPIRINHDDFFGYFRGSSGNYETWLDTCNCEILSVSDYLASIYIDQQLNWEF